MTMTTVLEAQVKKGYGINIVFRLSSFPSMYALEKNHVGAFQVGKEVIIIT